MRAHLLQMSNSMAKAISKGSTCWAGYLTLKAKYRSRCVPFFRGSTLGTLPPDSRCPETRKPRNPGLSAFHMVRTERLELSHLAAPEPKSGVSTNFTTSAKQGLNENARQCLALSGIWGGRRGSNPRHQEPQSCALPTELRPPYCICLCQSPKWRTRQDSNLRPSA